MSDYLEEQIRRMEEKLEVARATVRKLEEALSMMRQIRTKVGPIHPFDESFILPYAKEGLKAYVPIKEIILQHGPKTKEELYELLKEGGFKFAGKTEDQKFGVVKRSVLFSVKKGSLLELPGGKYAVNPDYKETE